VKPRPLLMHFGDPSGESLLDGLLPLFGSGDIALRGGLGLLLSLRGRPPLTGLLLKLLLGLGILIGLLLGLLRIFLRGLLLGHLAGLLENLAGLRLVLRNGDIAEVQLMLLFTVAGLGLILFCI
jgi:hypothetical protein